MNHHSRRWVGGSHSAAWCSTNRKTDLPAIRRSCNPTTEIGSWQFLVSGIATDELIKRVFTLVFIEINISIFYTFKRRRGLYFWSKPSTNRMWTPLCPKKADFRHETQCQGDTARPYCGQANPNAQMVMTTTSSLTAGITR